jgi:hypothetical protein
MPMSDNQSINIDTVEYHVQHINDNEIRLIPDYLIITLPVELEQDYVKEFGFEGRKVLIYKDLFTDSYLKDNLKEAIVEGKDNEVFTYTLVRHGDMTHGFGFYPLPLLFSDETTRAIVAEENGRSAPPNSWVRRKRKVILRKLGLDEQDFNHDRKKLVTGKGWVAAKKLYK